MKKLLISSLIASSLFSTLNAEIFTGTSLTGGRANSETGWLVRVDQYIGTSDYPWVYAKIGVSQESNPEWSAEYSAAGMDITSAIVGVGFNVIDYKGFFVDIAADYYYTINSTNFDGKTFNDSNGNPFKILSTTAADSTPAIELGVGYSFGSWSLRLDAIMTTNTGESKIEDSNSGFIHETTEDGGRGYLGLGVTYWY